MNPKKSSSKEKPAKKAAAKPQPKIGRAGARKSTSGKNAVTKPKKTAENPSATRSMPAKQKEIFKRLLLSMRARIDGQMTALKNDSLESTDSINMEEDGTDIFDRQFALNIVTSENEMLLEIDEALDRLDKGVYGRCDECADLIHEARLKALPFVKTCIACQSKLEQGTARMRPPPMLKEL